MKALVGAFNQEKALAGAFSVIVQPVVEPMEHYTALLAGAGAGAARGPGDIVLGPSHPQFGSHPWTLAHRGCGHRGLLINLPVAFVKSPSLDTNVRGKTGQTGCSSA